jgi:hypothetical protein
MPSSNDSAKVAGRLQVQQTGAKRANGGKPLMHLIPTEAVMALAEVLTVGAQNYGARNWEKGLTMSSTWDSLQRHLFAWWSGENRDPFSGMPHLSHALCNLVFMVTFERRIEKGTLPASLDDRPCSLDRP